MQTVSARTEIDQIFSDGKRVVKQQLAIVVRRTPKARSQEGRVLFVAGKKLGNAVLRNRAKRVLRESVRRAGGPWPGWDVALLARRETGSISAEELDKVLERLLRAAGVIL